MTYGETTKLSIDERVERGAAWLDKKLGPDWDKHIKISELDLKSSCDCVLGQLAADLHEGSTFSTLVWATADLVKSEVPGAIRNLGITYRQAVRRGFNASTDGNRVRHWDEYSQLTDAWKKKIRERRKARKQERAAA